MRVCMEGEGWRRREERGQGLAFVGGAGQVARAGLGGRRTVKTGAMAQGKGQVGVVPSPEKQLTPNPGANETGEELEDPPPAVRALHTSRPSAGGAVAHTIYRTVTVLDFVASDAPAG